MTTSEACELVVTLTRDLSEARGQRDGWRRVAMSALDYITEVERTAAMSDPNGPVYRGAMAAIKRSVDEQLDMDVMIGRTTGDRAA